MGDHIKNTALPRAAADVFGDFADLIQKELRLAKAEISEKIAAKLRAGLWMGVAGGIGFIAILLVIQGIVFGISSSGIPLHWSCLIVAGVLAAIAGGAYVKASADAREGMTPTRTLHQVQQDFATAKETLT